MAPLACNTTDVLNQSSSSSDSGNRSFPDTLSRDDDDSDNCFGKHGPSNSLEDTLSLTCDESISSNMSSSTSVGSNLDDSLDTGIIDVYQSPRSFRRRVLPLLNFPIAEKKTNNKIPIHLSVLKKRPSTRFFWFLCTLVFHVLVTAIDYKWVLESIRDTGLSEDTIQWRRFFERRAPKILRKISEKSTGRFYTVRIKGRRLDLVMQSLDYHAHCPSVKDVQVEWTDPTSNLPPKSVLNHKSGKVHESGKSSTSAILLLDEDIIIGCDDIERGESLGSIVCAAFATMSIANFFRNPLAFSSWREDPTRLVGFLPFQHSGDGEENIKSLPAGSPEFHLRSVSSGKGSYSMVSDKAVFIHNAILRSLPSLPTGCDHLSVSAIVSFMTSKPPVAVVSKPLAIRYSTLIPSASEDRQCWQWVDSLGGIKLPRQQASIVGHQKRAQESPVVDLS
jgi:hypothetical protein